VTRVAVVTGASSGIGRATAVHLSREGWDVVLAARGTGALDQAAAECAAVATGGARSLVVATDVGDAEAVLGLMSRAEEEFGGVDLVVNVAGLMSYGRVEETPAEIVENIMRTNVLGSFHVASAALPALRRRGGGVLVLVGSLLGQITMPLAGPYVSSKWAVRGLARVLREETRSERNLSVVHIAPGAVDTPIYRQAASYGGSGGRPPPPVVSPQAVARAIVRAADRPRREIGVGPANGLLRLAFGVVPGLYDRIVLPVMRVVGLEDRAGGDGPGNVLVPVGVLEAVRGGWSVLGRRTSS
jgi:NAD(P)-dependent dehydrogenase (short-subunit alcohol dehydrogenase family)